MKTMTEGQIVQLHAARTAKGEGYAPPLAECVKAAREGRLYDIDTRNAGHDGLDTGDDPASVIEVWAYACLGSTDGEGDAARVARWSAEQITLDVVGSACDLLRQEACARLGAPAGHDDPRARVSLTGGAVLAALADHVEASAHGRDAAARLAVVRAAGAAACAVCEAVGGRVLDLAGAEGPAA